MSQIGIATRQGADIHASDCDCAICREYRELETQIAEAERRSWLLNPWFLLRKLNGPDPEDIPEEVES